MNQKITTALLSVSDKTGITDLAAALHQAGVSIISTGGTAAALAAAGIPVTKVSDVTGFPEVMDGRVKTLHPKIHGGLLAQLDNPAHVAQMQETLAAHRACVAAQFDALVLPGESTRGDSSMQQAWLKIGAPQDENANPSIPASAATAMQQLAESTSVWETLSANARDLMAEPHMSWEHEWTKVVDSGMLGTRRNAA